MADFEEFTEEDWWETLAEFRLLVTSVGFADWDAHMMLTLGEDEEALSPRGALISYARSFGSFLKVRSSQNLERMRDELGDLLVDQEGQPIRDAVVSGGERPAGPSLLAGPVSDIVLEEVIRFANAVSGEPGYFDNEDGQE